MMFTISYFNLLHNFRITLVKTKGNAFYKIDFDECRIMFSRSAQLAANKCIPENDYQTCSTTDVMCIFF